jgi:cell division transport system ATP-binding protein
MKTALLKVENLSKVYPPEQNVWSQVQFSLDPGEFLYILGGSGAGKSSLLRTLSSFEQPSSGRVICRGVDLQSASASEIERVRKRISYIPQNMGLIPDLTVRDHVELTRFSLRSADCISDDQIRNYSKIMGLDQHWNRNIGLLSGGERQRVAILRGLSKKVDLLIADEPTGAQDFEMTWKLMDCFVRLQLTGTALLLATHDLEMVRRLRKRVGVLKDGFLKIEDSRATGVQT